MKHLVAVTLLGLAALAAPLARAQNSAVLNARIPFPFMVAEQRLPAGDYQVTVDPALGTVKLLSRESGEEAMALSTAGERRDRKNAAGKLTFHRYGAENFLRAVWLPGRGDGRMLPRSTTEREIAERLGPAETVEISPPAR
jgi:hypothetical protein